MSTVNLLYILLIANKLHFNITAEETETIQLLKPTTCSV